MLICSYTKVMKDFTDTITYRFVSLCQDMFWHIKLQLTYLFSIPFPSIIASSSRKFPAVILMTFLILQGDRGPQGPPGLPGEDGSRVSCCSHRKIYSEASYNGNKVMINVGFFSKTCFSFAQNQGEDGEVGPRGLPGEAVSNSFLFFCFCYEQKSHSDIFPFYWIVLNCRYKNYFMCLYIENNVCGWKANKWIETPLTGLELRIYLAKYIQLPESQMIFLIV